MAKSKTTTKKATSTKATKPAAAPTEYTAEKLAVQGKLPIGSSHVYHGKKANLDGQRLKVVEHESRGGIIVEFKGERYTVSPFAFIERPDDGKSTGKDTGKKAPKKAAAKATKPAQQPAPATAKPAPKKPAAPAAEAA